MKPPFALFLLLTASAHAVDFNRDVRPVLAQQRFTCHGMDDHGRKGKLQVDGLGGSYGVERLTHYNMLPTMGPPETTILEYPMADNSWDIEMAEFLEDIRLGRQPAAGLDDAIATLEIVDRIYRKSGHDNRA